ncbi:MAG: YlmC/YmxH family sporulation protein [Lachnospiraceae bacterium]|nr:YlmC/YmxH family sporulation protein [Lachnospiraceae bacterium]
MRLCELKEKDVINVCCGKKIGCVVDIEFDKKSCHVTALIVSQGVHFFNLFCNDEVVIPWCCIKQIGPDVILVELPG